MSCETECRCALLDLKIWGEGQLSVINGLSNMNTRAYYIKEGVKQGGDLFATEPLVEIASEHKVLHRVQRHELARVQG